MRRPRPSGFVGRTVIVVRDVTLIGVPYNSAGRPDGVARAPAALRAVGLADDIPDAGDVTFGSMGPRRDPSGVIDEPALASMTKHLGAQIAEALETGKAPLVVGGDCPILLGCLRGALRGVRGLGLLFVDGHEDAWPPHLSQTGEAADMELGFALGMHTESLGEVVRAGLPVLAPSDVVMLGPRDLREIENGNGTSLRGTVELHSWEELRGGIDRVAEAAAGSLHRRVGPWWLHVDLDVLSTEALPAIDYPQDGGLGWSELEAMTHAAMAVPGCLGWDVTIYNPDMDPEGTHARRIASYIRGAAPYLSSNHESGWSRLF
jgi:arginase